MPEEDFQGEIEVPENLNAQETILDVLDQVEQVSQPGLADITGYSQPTISNAVSDLEGESIQREREGRSFMVSRLEDDTSKETEEAESTRENLQYEVDVPEDLTAKETVKYILEEEGEVSQASLHRATGYTPGAISHAINDMKGDEIVREGNRGNYTVRLPETSQDVEEVAEELEPDDVNETADDTDNEVSDVDWTPDTGGSDAGGGSQTDGPAFSTWDGTSSDSSFPNSSDDDYMMLRRGVDNEVGEVLRDIYDGVRSKDIVMRWEDDEGEKKVAPLVISAEGDVEVNDYNRDKIADSLTDHVDGMMFCEWEYNGGNNTTVELRSQGETVEKELSPSQMRKVSGYDSNSIAVYDRVDDQIVGFFSTIGGLESLADEC